MRRLDDRIDQGKEKLTSSLSLAIFRSLLKTSRDQRRFAGAGVFANQLSGHPDISRAAACGLFQRRLCGGIRAARRGDGGVVVRSQVQGRDFLHPEHEERGEADVCAARSLPAMPSGRPDAGRARSGRQLTIHSRRNPRRTRQRRNRHRRPHSHRKPKGRLVPQQISRTAETPRNPDRGPG